MRESAVAREQRAQRAARRQVLDELALQVEAVLGLEPESVAIEPPNRVSLTITQLQGLLDLIPVQPTEEIQK